MMNQGLNPLELVLNASIIVQIVMALLLLASIVSWSIMLRKRAELRRAKSDADRFEEVFWSGGDLTAMFRAIDQGRRVTKGMEAIFEQGFREFQRMRQQGGFASAQLLEGARRAAERKRSVRAQPLDARDGRLDQPLCRPVRHGVGNHERVPRPR
jgi:biopolymer transport protein TolQ